MNVVVNGEEKSLPDGVTVAELIRSMHLDKAACAVEVNKRLVRKPDHPTAALAEGDVIEIVTLVGGG